MKPQSFDNVHSFRVQIDSVDFTVTITDRIFASEKDFFIFLITTRCMKYNT